MSVTAAKWVDSWERLQFRFFLNLFSCLLIMNLSRRNNTFSLSKERQQRVNPHYIPRLFTQSRCHQRCSLDRDRMQITRFSLYDHDATQSECAHRLVWHGSMDIKVIVIWLPPHPPTLVTNRPHFYCNAMLFMWKSKDSNNSMKYWQKEQFLYALQLSQESISQKCCILFLLWKLQTGTQKIKSFPSQIIHSGWDLE